MKTPVEQVITTVTPELHANSAADLPEFANVFGKYRKVHELTVLIFTLESPLVSAFVLLADNTTRAMKKNRTQFARTPSTKGT